MNKVYILTYHDQLIRSANMKVKVVKAIVGGDNLPKSLYECIFERFGDSLAEAVTESVCGADPEPAYCPPLRTL